MLAGGAMDKTAATAKEFDQPKGSTLMPVVCLPQESLSGAHKRSRGFRSACARLGSKLCQQLGVLPHKITEADRFLHILQSASRSFRGHIGILLSRTFPGIDVGPVFERGPDGHLVQCALTYARNDGIRKLQEKYPWADYVDWRVFLEGFDAGVEWASHNPDKTTPIPARLP
jgi:hypothetical protein